MAKKKKVTIIKKKLTLKQKKMAKAMVENGGNASKAMIDVGFSPATAHNPQKITKTDEFQELMDKHLPDEELMEVHKDGLHATERKTGFAKVKVKGKFQIKTVIVEVPDHSVRHKFLDTAYKIKGKIQKEGSNVVIPIQVNVNEDREKYA